MTNTLGQSRTIALHACCGPCSLEPSRLLAEQGFAPVIYYANSNIHPRDEYAHRLETLKAWAAEAGIPVVEGMYDPQTWEDTAGRIGDAALQKALQQTCEEPAREAVLRVDPHMREARCRACYRLRFEETARWAREQGIAYLGTTLSVSPYQYTQVIAQELERAAEHEGLTPVFEDYRPNYDEATRRSRELGMYRQNFCGCRISDAEAQAERAERKAARAAAAQAKREQQAAQRSAQDEQRAREKAAKKAYNDKQQRKRAVLKALREENRRTAREEENE